MKKPSGKHKSFPDLPVAPLVAALNAAAERHWNAEVGVCAEARIDPRILRSWRKGEYDFVTFRVADRVLTGMGWLYWEVWEPGTPAGALAEAAFQTGDFSAVAA